MKKLDKFTSSTAPKRKPKSGDMTAMTAMPGGRKAIFVREEDASGQPSEHFRILEMLESM